MGVTKTPISAISACFNIMNDNDLHIASFCKIDASILDAHPCWYFVYGDNTYRRGRGGAAALRDYPHTYGFVTKRYPSNADDAFFTPMEYTRIFEEEKSKFYNWMDTLPINAIVIVSQVGKGLANRYKIWEEIIEPWWRQLRTDPRATRPIVLNHY